MAEGFAKHILKDYNTVVFSAGVQADGFNQLAIKVMSEVGIDIEFQISKTINLLDLSQL